MLRAYRKTAMFFYNRTCDAIMRHNDTKDTTHGKGVK